MKIFFDDQGRKPEKKRRDRCDDELKNRREQTQTALNNFNFVMPNCYAKAFIFFKKPIISFIINAIIKVVPTTGLEPV